MSTRKSLGAIGTKCENVDSTKDKDNETLSNVTDDDEKTISIVEAVASVKVETDNASRASTPTQKESPKSSPSGTINRVTRNSPLLVSPNAKKDLPGVETDSINSEGEDGGLVKKQIRGRKSIKEAKESANKEHTKESLNKTAEELREKDSKSKEKEKDGKNVKDCKDSKEKIVKNTDEVEEEDVKDCKVSKEIDMNDPKEYDEDVKDADESKEKDLKDSLENKEKNVKDSKENKDKEIKDSKETKDKDLKEIKDLKEAVAISNRLTRNAAAQEVASKSRITRNRQSSAGSATRPETPPTARRGRPLLNRKPTEIVVSQKRKRSVEDPVDSPINKTIKSEPKDSSDPTEEDESTIIIPSAGNTDLDGVRIKQELIESDDGGSTTTEVSSSTFTVTPTVTTGPTPTTMTTTTSRGRGGRWAGRRPTQTASPTTRSTRQNKMASPVPSNSPVLDRKRRRTAGIYRRGSSLQKSTTPDEDSKDSMASSMDDILLTDIKMEKLTPELEDNQDVDMDLKKSLVSETDESIEQTANTVTENEVVKPLTVETEIESEIADVLMEDEEESTNAPGEVNASEITPNCSNKDASLSPELLSEGVSEISVKQFYKRPKFLENNLGIEEDPKLGEIVQKVTTEMDDNNIIKDVTDIVSRKEPSNEGREIPIDSSHTLEIDDIISETNIPHEELFSAESINEGDLIYEESIEGKKTPSHENSTSSLNINLMPPEEESVKIDDGEDTESKVSLEIVDANATEIEDEEEPLERLVIAEEDLEDDDITVEESETISMDNNPSLHDDAPEEEQDTEEDNQVDELPEDIIEVLPNDILVEEITDEETKQTSNKCDMEKAKLQENEENGIGEKEIKENKAKNKHFKIENELIEERNSDEIDKEVAAEEVGNAKEQKSRPSVVEKKDDYKRVDERNRLNILDAFEIKKDAKSEIKSIILAKIDSDEKEPKPTSLLKALKTEKKEVKTDKGALETKSSCREKRLSTSKPANSTQSDEVKTEKMEIDEIIKDKEAGTSEDQTMHEKMDTSRPVTPKDEKFTSNILIGNSQISTGNRDERDSKDDDVSSIKSTQSTDATSWTTIEPDCDDEEKLREKEQHFKNLGLLTHKAAEKRRQEFIQSAAATEATRVAAANHTHGKRNGNKPTVSTNSSNHSATSHEYTGTLKTVIKLNRNSSGNATGSTTTMTVTTATASNGNSSRKSHFSNVKDSNSCGVRRQSLKMTFQKGRARGHTAHGSDRSSINNSGTQSGDHNVHGEDLYYTIQNENEGAEKNSGGSSLSTATAGIKDQQTQKQQTINNNNTSNVQTHGRKPYNSRSNTSNSYHNYQNHNHLATNSSHIDSSHSDGHHDGSTQNAGAHVTIGISSHKKDDREEILIPEKASSFKFHPGRLCEDQCYYCSGKFGLYDTPCHVGQIKSLERQQKILKNEEKLTVDNCLCDACFRHVDRRANVPSYKKRLSATGQLENVNASGERQGDESSTANNAEESEEARKCVVPDCEQPASHSLRRKCIRKSVKKFLLNFDMPTGSPYIWLCQSHYDSVIQCSGCVLCKRRLGKNHMYHITSDTDRLEKALTDMGIPVQLGIGTAVCKLCRYFANLLMKPPDSTKSQKAEFVKNYRKRLLQFHNIHDVSNEVSEADEDENNAKCTASTRNESASIKGNKTSQPRRGNKDQHNMNSPTASSSSSVICMTENALDHSEEIVSSKNTDESQKQSTLLENDVLMGYGISAQNSNGETSNENSKSPPPSSSTENEKQNSRLKAILQSEGKSKSSASNDLPCALLRANPNLSMRELFPGEEDLGLNFKAPFGSSNSQRTPEGWTRVQTFLQYDEPTRRLWEELQKPYGNQSSFLRHLILLEKYYRNGDLVLSANASSNASVYTQTVRQRLNSYDQGHCGGLETDSSLKSPSSTAKEKTKTKDIPLVEINDDDEDVNGNENPSNNREEKVAEDEDDDVIMEEPVTSIESNSTKRRTRTVSVDKLTKQLSTNAVTIIARSKDSTQLVPVGTGKNVAIEAAQKRVDSSNPQNTTLSNIHHKSTASTPLVPQNNAALANSVALNSIASNSSNSRSILKSNLLGITNNKSVEILPITAHKSSANANTVISATVNVPPLEGGVINSSASSIGGNNSSSSSSNSSGSSKQQKILEVANKLLDSQMEAAAAVAKQQNASLLTSPPELVSLPRRGASNIASSSNTTNTSSTMSSTTASLINAKRPHLISNRPTSHNRGGGLSPNVVILPDTLSTHERAESKSWRPTLMSVEENQHLLNKNGPLYQTADGRKLPGLVQVQSGGKPFLISIFDYNRMCILRREKLMRDRMLSAGKHKSQLQQQRHMQQSSNNYNKMSNSGSNSSNSSSSSNSSKHGQATAAQQQQLMQMLQYQKQQQQQAAMKAVSNANNNRYHPIAPKPSLTSSSSNLMVGPSSSNSNSSNININNMGNNSRLSANQTNFPMPLLANALSNANAVNAAAAAASIINNSWQWSHFPDAHDFLRNGVHGGPNKLPPLLPKPTSVPSTSVASSLAPPATITSKQLQQQQQMLIDNTLMSKIPKSLTVIPQHKLMGSNASNKE